MKKNDCIACPHVKRCIYEDEYNGNVVSRSKLFCTYIDRVPSIYHLRQCPITRVIRPSIKVKGKSVPRGVKHCRGCEYLELNEEKKYRVCTYNGRNSRPAHIYVCHKEYDELLRQKKASL